MPRPNEFDGRVALVTGAAGAGIGGATCRRLAADGAAIVALDEHPRRTDELVHAIEAEFGVPTLGVCADVSDRDAVDAAMAGATERLGPIDILVNNAAINIQGGLFDLDPADFDRVVAVDLTACWYLMRAVAPPMRDRGRGIIVNVSSVAAYNGGNGREYAYSASKAALNELTRAAAVECGPFGIRCNAVAPGIVHSKWVEKHLSRYDDFLADTPLRRHADPADVANVIAFLASDESAHVTGEVINVSGGWLLTP